MTSAIVILAVLLSGMNPSPHDAVRVETVTEYVYVAATVDCQEDEAWAAVHFDTAGAVEDMHGVSRKCVPVDDLYAAELHRLAMAGIIVWEWDLPVCDLDYVLHGEDG